MNDHSQAKCLNCGEKISGNYCPACGQSTRTHRLSLKHFLLHDMLHGILHLDKGILYSLKLILLRPGKTATAYLKGKRAGHFNIVTLLILLAATFFFVTSLGSHGTQHRKILIGGLNATEWVHNNGKWLLLSIVPLLSLASLPVFRRARYNYTEHLLVNSYFMVGFLIFITVAAALNRIEANPYRDIVVFAAIAVELGFLLWVYWQVYRSYYSLAGWIWRLIATLLLWIVIMVVLLLLIVLVAALLSKGSQDIEVI